MGKETCTAALVAALLLSISGGSAGAAETVLGGGFARDCQLAAERAADQRSIDDKDVLACNLAVETQPLTRRDLAASFVNRGILSLSRKAYDAALKDFDAAIDLTPDLGGAYANRGAALIAEGQPAQGIAEIDHSLALGGPEPEKSYYNRALAREELGDVKGAYFDYLEASQLKPGWSEPARELARFKVTRARDVTG